MVLDFFYWTAINSSEIHVILPECDISIDVSSVSDKEYVLTRRRWSGSGGKVNYDAQQVDIADRSVCEGGVERALSSIQLYFLPL